MGFELSMINLCGFLCRYLESLKYVYFESQIDFHASMDAYGILSLSVFDSEIDLLCLCVLILKDFEISLS